MPALTTPQTSEGKSMKNKRNEQKLCSRNVAKCSTNIPNQHLKTKFDLAYKISSCFEHKKYACYALWSSWNNSVINTGHFCFIVLGKEEGYTVSVKGKIALLVLPSLFLNGCLGSGGTATPSSDTVSGGKSAVVSTNLLGEMRKHTPRPSATLGIFSSMYLSQG
ncbi:MAG: hypothetical protein PHO54_03325, partial [Candidatus Peribacteraceae bacterium]|nr:hypothetical protein [Candidatus Peribacteraceae bacterium]